MSSSLPTATTLREIQRRYLRLDYLAAALVLIFLCSYLYISVQVYHYGYWRHDALRYLVDFEDKFASEGRWVLYLLFPVLRWVPPFPSWLASLALLFAFFFLIARRQSCDRLDSTLIGLIAISSTSLFAQLNWPVTTIPAIVVLLIGYWLRYHVGRFATFMITSVLMFGAVQFGIYVLPLLFLDDLRNKSGGRALATLVAIVLNWALGYVLGYAVSQLFVFLITGHWIEIAAWRNPHYATSLTSLLDNLSVNLDLLQSQIFALFPLFDLLALAFVLTALYSAVFAGGVRKLGHFIPVAILGLAITAAHYVAVAPSGIFIEIRTAWPLFIGVALVFYALSAMVPVRVVNVAAAIAIGIPALFVSGQNATWFRYESEAGRLAIAQALPRPGNTYEGVVLDARQFDAFHTDLVRGLPERVGLIESLDEPMRLVPALHELGFANVGLCEPGQDSEQTCALFDAEPFRTRCDGNPELVCANGVTSDGTLLLTLMP